MVQITSQAMVEWLLNTARLNRSELARRLGVDVSTIARWLSGCVLSMKHYIALRIFYCEIQGTIAVKPASLLEPALFQFKCSLSASYGERHREVAEADLTRFLTDQKAFLSEEIFAPDKTAKVPDGPAAERGFSIHAFPADLQGPARAHLFYASLTPHPVVLILYKKVLSPPARREALTTEFAHALNEVQPLVAEPEGHKNFIARVRRPSTRSRPSRTPRSRS